MAKRKAEVSAVPVGGDSSVYFRCDGELSAALERRRVELEKRTGLKVSTSDVVRSLLRKAIESEAA